VIDDVAIDEGDSGISEAEFHVTLLFPDGEYVEVDYQTEEGSALEGRDYDATSGRLEFADDETTQIVSVSVRGDKKVEDDETFFVELSGPSGAVLGQPLGVGTIRDDDAVDDRRTLEWDTQGPGSVSLAPPGGLYDDGTVVTLTALPDAGHFFSGWSGDLSSVQNPASLVMSDDRSVEARFLETASTLRELGSGTSTDSSQVATAESLTGVAGDLYLAAIAFGPDSSVTGVSGLGLVWSPVRAQCTARGKTGVAVWQARGHPSQGQEVTADLSDEVDSAVIVVSRYEAAAGLVGVGAVASANTEGVSGACDGGSDSDDYALDLAVGAPDSLVYVAVAPRDGQHDAGPGYTDRTEVHSGSGSNRIGLSIADGAPGSGSPARVTGSLSEPVDWAVVTLEIRALETFDLDVEAGFGGSVDLDPPGGTYVLGDEVVLTATPDAGFAFASWSGDLSGSTNPVIVVVDEDRSVSANFVREYTVSVEESPGGEVRLDPPGGVYPDGSEVTVTATPDLGFVFANWTGDLSGSENPTTLVVDEDLSASARFLAEFTVNVVPTAGGEVSLDPPGGVYTEDSELVVTANPAPGFVFASWTGDVSGSESPLTVVVGEDLTLSASFLPEVHLSVKPTVGGEVDLDPPGGVYAEGSTVTLTARPEPDFAFTDWSGDLSGSSSPASLVLDTDKTVSAGFVQTFPLTVEALEGGRVLLEPPGGVYAKGSVVTLTAMPDPGFVFVSWGGDLSGSLTPASLSMEGERSVSASFVRLVTLSVGEGAGGGVRLEPPGGVYVEGSTVTLTATPDPGFAFASWSGDLSGSSSPTLLVLDTSKSVLASFLREFTLDVEQTPGGQVQLDPPGGTYLDGSVVTLTALPDPGFVFADWNGELAGRDTPSTLVVDADRALSASFVPQRRLAVTPVSGGQVRLDPPGGVYGEGSLVTLTALPDPGLAFAGWSGDLSGTSNPASLLMDADKQVSASFLPAFSLTVEATEGGSVQLEPPGGRYAQGSLVTLTATSDAGFGFEAWSHDLEGSAISMSLVVDGDKLVGASFLPGARLTLESTPGGSILSEPSGLIHDLGSFVKLTATPDPGFVFGGWSRDLVARANPALVIMDTHQSVLASFVPEYTLTLQPGVGGRIDLDPPGGVYVQGSPVRLEAIPDPGYRFRSWTGDLVGSANPASLVMQADLSVGAIFAPEFTVSVVPTAGGSVRLEPPSGVYVEGSLVRVDAIPEAGHRFTGWSGDLSGGATPSVLVLDSHQTIAAHFAREVTVSLEPSPGGQVHVQPSGGIYLAGSVVTLTAIADPGQRFMGWGDDLGSTNPLSLVLDIDRHVSSSFAPEFTVFLTPASGGHVVLDPPGGVYVAGSSVRVEAIPDPGHRFMGFTGDLSGTDSPGDLLVDADKTVGARFARPTLTLLAGPGGQVQADPPGPIYDLGSVVTVTALPDPGNGFDGWTGDQSGTTNPVSLVMDDDRSLGGVFSPRPPRLEEIHTGTATGTNSVATDAPVGAAGGGLYLAAIAVKPGKAVTGVSGLGLEWSPVRAQCGGRSQTFVAVWQASGEPVSEGVVRATLDSEVASAVIAVSRYSGVAEITPLGSEASLNTLGVAGACAGGTDSASYSLDLDTTGPSSLVYLAAGARFQDHVPGPGYTERAQVFAGATNGEIAGVSVADRDVPIETRIPANGSFPSNVDWAVVVLELRALSATP